jgi:SpoVK/Ycf46/Vps4 family AAA+-type ATPase
VLAQAAPHDPAALELADALEPLPLAAYVAAEAAPDRVAAQVCQADLERAAAQLSPSLSREQLEHYQRLRKQFHAGTD